MKSLLHTKHLKDKFKLPFFIALACLLRMGSFFNLMLDYDEWTYWEIARQMHAGKVLYSDLIDLKAPGIFYTFMLIEKIALQNMVLARIIAAVLLGIAAFSVARIGERLFQVPGVFSGMLFLLHFNYAMGLALNTELFYVSFTAIGAWLFIGKVNKLLRLCGLLLMGFAFSIKVFAAVDILFLITLFALSHYRTIDQGGKGSIAPVLKTLFSGLITFIPFLLIHLGFYLWGNWDAFYNAIYVLPGKYAAGTDVKKQIDLVALYHFRFIWIVVPAYWGLRLLFRSQRIWTVHAFLWLISSWFLLLLSSRLHDHYWLQLAIPMSLLASVGLKEISVLRKPVTRKLMPYFLLGLLLSSFMLQMRSSKQTNASIESVMQGIPPLKGNEKLWVANGPAVYYQLLQKDCPGAYIHGSLSFDPRHAQAYGIDREKYWSEQLDSVKCVVFCQGSPVDEAFRVLLGSRFKCVDKIGGVYSIWIRD